MKDFGHDVSDYEDVAFNLGFEAVDWPPPAGWRVVESVNLAGEGRLPPMAGLVAVKAWALLRAPLSDRPVLARPWGVATRHGGDPTWTATAQT
jgi:hypothetical protein